MNPKFILPVSFALTAHVFLLFGLPGRAPVSIAPAAVEPPLPADPARRLLIDEPMKTADEPGEPEPDVNRKANLASRQEEIPIAYPGRFEITIPTLPSISSGGPTGRISPDWVSEREKPGGPPRGIMNRRDLDRVPRARVQPSPVYPADMRELRVEGCVVVEFLVDEAGNAYDPVVVSATRRAFVEPALRAVARWKFEPGFKDGRRVRYRMSVPLVFKLDRD